MNRKTLLILLCSHLGLMILASTRLTVLSWMWGDGSWTWDYLNLTYRNAWGNSLYVSGYTLSVVMAYLATYIVGAVAFWGVWKKMQDALSCAGTVLCVVGFGSFLIELSHWVIDHHLSLIVSCPALMLVLTVVVIVRVKRKIALPYRVDNSSL